MKKYYVISFILCTSVLFAQAPDSLWIKTYGGTSSDYGWSVQQTSDGGYIITGYTSSFGAGNVLLLKTNPFGDALWIMTFGGADHEYGRSVQETTDGGYIIAGYTRSFGAGDGDVYLIKTDSSGDTLWTKIYGGIGVDVGWSVQQTSDGGYIVAGYTGSYGAGGVDVYLIKTDSSGDTLWTKTYGGTGDDVGRSVQQTTDNGYVIAGRTDSYGAGDDDVYFIKTNSSGDTLWTKTYGGTYEDWARSVQQTSDSGYILAGYTSSFGAGGIDVYLIRTDSSGDTLWTRTYGGTNFDYGRSVQETTDGGYIIAGYTRSFGAGDGDVYLIKTDSSGDTLWTKTYGGTSYDYGWAVQQTTDGGYIVAGATLSFGAGVWDVYLIKTRSGPGVDEHLPVDVSENQISATIFSGPLQFPQDKTCRVFDITGQEVKPYLIQSGIYFIEIEGKITQKVIKVK